MTGFCSVDPVSVEPTAILHLLETFDGNGRQVPARSQPIASELLVGCSLLSDARHRSPSSLHDPSTVRFQQQNY